MCEAHGSHHKTVHDLKSYFIKDLKYSVGNRDDSVDENTKNYLQRHNMYTY